MRLFLKIASKDSLGNLLVFLAVQKSEVLEALQERLCHTQIVSRYSTICDTISRDAPYSAMGFRGKVFPRYPLLQDLSLIAIGHVYGRKRDVAAIVCDTTEKQCDREVRQVSRDGGVYFGRGSKILLRTLRSLGKNEQHQKSSSDQTGKGLYSFHLLYFVSWTAAPLTHPICRQEKLH